MSEGYIWSAMLGCFVGPAEAARGVPERFSFANKHRPARVLADRDNLAGSIPAEPEPPKAPAEDVSTRPTQAPVPAVSGERMEVDPA